MSLWVYIQVDQNGFASNGKGIFQVGFYTANGTWHRDTDHGVDRESAAARVNYLNGGIGVQHADFIRLHDEVAAEIKPLGNAVPLHRRGR
jgi:hypothetical protein